MNLIAVTACPTGIAHSQMAAENLENTAEELGHEIQVEVEGAMGTENELSSEQIAAADAVIVAADTKVQTGRFEGVPVIKGSVKDAVNDAEDLIRRAVDAAGGEGAGDAAAGSDQAGDATAGGDETGATAAGDAASDPAPGAQTKTDDAEAATDADTESADEQPAGSNRRERRERKGLVGKLKSLFS